MEKENRKIEWQNRLYLILSGIFIASLVSSNLIFQKFFSWPPCNFFPFFSTFTI